MRRSLTLFLSSFLLLGLLLPTSSVAKADKKAPAKSSAANNGKASETKPATPAPNKPKAEEKVEKESVNKESTSTTSSAPSSAPGNSGTAPSNGANPGNPNTSSSSSDSNKPETTGKPEVTGKPETPGKSEVVSKKDVTLDEGEVKNFIVRFRDDVSIASEATNLRAQEARVSRTFSHVFKGLATTLNAKQLEALKKNPRVEVIEEDIEVRTTSLQTNATWGLDRVDQRALPLDNTFTYSTFGNTVRAYVIDTGLRSSHQEFTGRVQAGFTAISDGRGTDDCNGHGTHVAGTIAGTTFGVSKFATIVPVRVLACDGSGSLSGVVAGLDWIAANHPSGAPAVANMSLGGGGSSTLDSAVNNLINRGITVVVAAGNSSASACNYSPARVPAAITVAASTINDQLASYSNHGSCVDIVAPGSSITSASITSNTSSAVLSGTSMASPHVAGAVVALFATGYLSPANVDSQVKSLATTGVFSSLPSGTPNSLLYAVSSTPSVDEGSNEPAPTPTPVITLPDAPTGVVAKPLKRAAELNWVRASKDGGSPITSQIINVFSNGSLARTVTVSGTSTAATIRSLNSRLSYTFTIQAVNAIGAGPASSPSDPIFPLK